MTVDFKGTPIHYQTYGAGKSVVLLHGFLEQSKIWDDFIPLLKDKYRILTLDLFGHGASPSYAETHSMELYADAVAAVMDEVGMKSAALIGHSMGGYISLALLERYPEKIERLLLMDSSSRPDSEKRLKERDQVLKIVGKHKKAFVQMGVSNLFAEQSKSKFKKELDWLIAEAMKMSPQAIQAAVRGMKIRKDRTQFLKDFTGKKWIIAGEDDGLIPVESLREVAAETGAELLVFPDGHLSYIEQKSGVEKAVSDFLS